MIGQDVYKLLSQAVFGGDHLLTDRERFRRELAAEWNSLPEDVAEGVPPLQVIDPEGLTARIHMVPVKRMGTGLNELTAFLAGQELKRGAREKITALWRSFLDSVRDRDPLFDPETLASFEPGSSPLHHSIEYGFASYRICNDILSERSVSWLEERGILLPGQ